MIVPPKMVINAYRCKPVSQHFSDGWNACREEIMGKQIDIEKAAMAYGDATAAHISAIQCGMPLAITSATKKNLDEAEHALLCAAQDYHNDHFDGAES